MNQAVCWNVTKSLCHDLSCRDDLLRLGFLHGDSGIDSALDLIETVKPMLPDIDNTVSVVDSLLKFGLLLQCMGNEAPSKNAEHEYDHKYDDVGFHFLPLCCEMVTDQN